MQNNFSDRDIYLPGDDMELQIRADKLFAHQIQNWKMAGDGYRSLKEVQKKIFDFGKFSIEAHFNPGRIISSSAKVDEKSINDRPCFLCAKNLPSEQMAVKIFGEYILLVNPFPIFDRHFTIPVLSHRPQLIYNDLENMLDISAMLGSKYSVFYNGPKCGASAPDHLHFQAGNFGFMKIDNEYETIIESFGRIIKSNDNCRTVGVMGCLRNFFSVESNKKREIINEFNSIYEVLVKTEDEPLLNLICSYNDKWRLLIFPRTKHRPSYFFEEEERKILISPAAVDLGGVLIFPREEDFDRVNEDLITDIFKQVTFSDEEFVNISDRLANKKNREL